MSGVFAVFLGGGVGSVLRYLLGRGIERIWEAPGFYGTLSANVIGSFIIGAVAALVLSTRFFATPTVQLALTTGLLGGFTTFSAFSLDTLKIAQSGSFWHAAIYAFATLLLCLAAVSVGYFAIRVAGRI